MLINAEPEFEFAIEMAKKYGAKPETALPMYLEFKRHFRPIITRTDGEVLADIFDKIRADLQKLEDGVNVDLKVLMKDNGIDLANRSDTARARKFVSESGLLQYRGPEPEQWVRRITGPMNGTAAPESTAAAE